MMEKATTISKNNNPFPVKLLNRKWYIIDSMADLEIVQGEGVIGEQPIIQSDDYHIYSSGCHLKSDIGRMHGSYTFINAENDTKFKVKIPAFTMVSKMRLN